MLKILFVIAVFAVIYFLFFKKSKAKKKELEDMVECDSCKVFVSLEEAIEKNGKYYCSKECLN